MARNRVPAEVLTDSVDVALAFALFRDGRWDRPVTTSFASEPNELNAKGMVMAGSDFFADFLNRFRFEGELLQHLMSQDCLAHVPESFWAFLEGTGFGGSAKALPEGQWFPRSESYASLTAKAGEYVLYRSGIATIFDICISAASEVMPLVEAAAGRAPILDGGSQYSLGHGWSLWVAAGKRTAYASAEQLESTRPQVGDLFAPGHSGADRMLRPEDYGHEERCRAFQDVGYSADEAEELSSGGIDIFFLPELDDDDFASIKSTIIGPSLSAGTMLSAYTPLSVFKLFKEADYNFSLCDTYYQGVFPALPLEPMRGLYGDRPLDEGVEVPGLARHGTARVRHRGTPIYLAESIEDLKKVCDVLAHHETTLFRGQTRQYLLNRPPEVCQLLYLQDEVVEPSLLSSAYRLGLDADRLVGLLHLELQDILYENENLAEYADAVAPRVAPLLDLLQELPVPDLAAHTDYWTTGGSGRRTREAIAVAQHYGIPTSGLDLTASLDVAVWFATHRLGSAQDGVAHYSPYEWSGEDPSSWPCIYFFVADQLESQHFAIAPFLRGSAVRPRNQQAFLRYGSWGWHSNDAAESLRAIVHLAPGFSGPEQSGSELFPGPDDDPFLATLLKRRERWRREPEAAQNAIYKHLFEIVAA